MRFFANAYDSTRAPGGNITGYQLLMAAPDAGDNYTVVFDTVKNST